MTTALDVQEGGNHYKNMKYQPVVFAHNINATFLEGNVIKYITRYKFKNGLEDLKKVKHYIELMLQLVYGREPSEPNDNCIFYDCNEIFQNVRREYEEFKKQNTVPAWEAHIIWLVISSSYKGGVNDLNHAWKLTVELIKDEYGVDL